MRHNGSRRRVNAALINRGRNETGIRIASPDVSGGEVSILYQTTAGDLHVVPVYVEAFEADGALVYFRGSLKGLVVYDQASGTWRRAVGGPGASPSPRLSALVFAVASTPSTSRPSRLRRLVRGDREREPL